MRQRLALASGALALALALPAAADEAAPSTEWRAFEGTWSISGRRQTVAVEGGREGAVVEWRGSVALSRGESLGLGFFGQAIGFDDGQGVSLGRAVWTDAHADRIYTRLKGETLATGRRIVGTVSGGTGSSQRGTRPFTRTAKRSGKPSWRSGVPRSIMRRSAAGRLPGHPRACRWRGGTRQRGRC